MLQLRCSSSATAAATAALTKVAVAVAAVAVVRGLTSCEGVCSIICDGAGAADCRVVSFRVAALFAGQAVGLQPGKVT